MWDRGLQTPVDEDMTRLLLICLAGAAGTGSRYLIALWTARRFGPAFPYGTIFVNLAGCFLIAGIIDVATVKGWPETARLALTIGFLGGFTTYSSFNQETMRMAATGAVTAASLNVVVTLVGGFIAGLCGRVAARALLD